MFYLMRSRDPEHPFRGNHYHVYATINLNTEFELLRFTVSAIHKGHQNLIVGHVKVRSHRMRRVACCCGAALQQKYSFNCHTFTKMMFSFSIIFLKIEASAF